MMLAQVESFGIKAFTDQYGAFGFGIVAVCLLLLVISSIWQRVIKPTIDVQFKIAEQNALSTHNISVTAQSLQMSLTQSINIADRQDDILRRLERLETNAPTTAS